MHTGDIVMMDEQGWFRVLDRAKELIKYKGYQVAPGRAGGHRAVPSLRRRLRRHRQPGPEAGEVPKAFVVLRPGCTADGILDWVAQRVAPYQKIRRLEVTGQIPKSASGQILRRTLLEAERTALSQTLIGARS